MHILLNATDALAFVILRDVFSMFLTALLPSGESSCRTVPMFITAQKIIATQTDDIIYIFLTFREPTHIIRDQKFCDKW